MNISTCHLAWVFASLAMPVAAVSLYSAEHPSEHPKEHPAEHPAGASLSPDQIASAITDFLKADAKLHGGHFLYYDAKKKEPLALTLVCLHKDRIGMLKDDLCFVCADSNTPTGRAYGLDFFLTHATGKRPRVTEMTLHKEAGAPRYSWGEKSDQWICQ